MEILALKLALTPALIALASLVGRRWGPAVSGWLIGIPFTSGPIAFFLALSHGSSFAATAALGTLAGTISQAGFCLAYAWLATGHDWPRALAAACIVFAAITAVLHTLTLSWAVLLVAVPLTLVIALRLMPRRTRPGVAVGAPPWDLPARMVIATTFVLLITGLAPVFGPQLTGLLAPFPLYATILATFAHHQQGPEPARGVMGGLLFGLFGFAGFFVALAGLLGRVEIATAFISALIVALALQVVSLAVLRRASAILAPTCV